MISSRAFDRIVAEDVSNKATQAQRDYLELPENCERWQQAGEKPFQRQLLLIREHLAANDHS